MAIENSYYQVKMEQQQQMFMIIQAWITTLSVSKMPTSLREKFMLIMQVLGPITFVVKQIGYYSMRAAGFSKRV